MRVHDHDFDPSCREILLGGYLIGECIHPQAMARLRQAIFGPDDEADSEG